MFHVTIEKIQNLAFYVLIFFGSVNRSGSTWIVLESGLSSHTAKCTLSEPGQIVLDGYYSFMKKQVTFVAVMTKMPVYKIN